MNKASSTLLATAGVTVGLLGFALPAGASVSGGNPLPTTTCSYSNPQSTTDSFAFTGGSGDYKGGGDKGGSGGYNGGGDKGGSGGYNGGGDPCSYPKNPCPTKTYNPCPPKPCEWVKTKPCKDKHEHWGYAKAKRTYVCHPKPCPTKAKPCPPKCKKGVHHRHGNKPVFYGVS